MVYVVWYKSVFFKDASIWSVYDSQEKADKAVETILKDGYGFEAWSNSETVL